jgi:hypothetical protein
MTASFIYHQLTTSGNGDTFGSLTIGGYDRSRFVQHDGSWLIDGTNNLAVQLESISMTTAGTSQGLLPTPIITYIDSSLPYIWLPKEACLLFEVAFGLEWDDTSQLYLVNDTLHQTLVQQNASLTFNLGGMTGGSSSNVDITLPYAAFDLTASTPLVTNTTRYFPLKRAANSTQYLMGRTFFQEAFVIADYERRNFSIFPCQWEANVKPDIVSTFSPTYGNGITPVAGPAPSSTASSTAHSGGSSSSAGPIAGGVVGGIALITIIAALFYFFYWRPKRRRDYTTHGEKSELFAPLPPNPALALDDPTLDKAELANTQRTSSTVPELEGSHGTVFEMPAREYAGSEMLTNNNRHEVPSPEPSEVTSNGYPWRSVSERGEQEEPSEVGSPASPRLPLQGLPSPMSSPGLPSSPSRVPSPTLVESSVPSPLPSPPITHSQPFSFEERREE